MEEMVQPAAEEQPTQETPLPAVPETDTEQVATAEVESPEVDVLAPFSWQASEFIHHQKQFGWYGLFALAVVVMVGVALVTHQWFSAAVFVAMAGTLAVYAKKEPRTLSYRLDEDGVTVGQKLYHFDQFRSFSVFNDVAWHSIDLDPTQRFLPRLTLIFESKDLGSIEPILSAYLPRIDRQPDLVERLTRSLKF